MKRIRRVVRPLALVSAAGLALLILGEITVRLYLALPAPPDAPHVADPHAGFRIRPNFGDLPESHPDHINAFGFRDREHAVTKPPGTVRIVGIGDSFVFGVVPPEENFLRVAESRLDAALGDTITAEMCMMGLGGYSTENAVGVLRSIALSLDPDVVVLCFFVGNDVTGIPLRAEVLRGRRYFTGASRPLHRLARRSRLFLLTEHALVRLVHAADREVAARRDPPADVVHAAKRPAPGARFLKIQRARLPVYLEPWSQTVERLWLEAESYLATFDRLCDEAGVPWALFVIPSEIQVDADVRAAVLAAERLPADALDVDAPQRRLARTAAAYGAWLVDPLEDLRRRHAPDSRLYIPDDTHWNTRGNRIAGELLAREILARLEGSR